MKLKRVLHTKLDINVSINFQKWKRNGFGFWVLNTTFSNISVVLLWSILLVEETRTPWDYDRPVNV